MKRLQRLLGYEFRDEALLNQALTHRSLGSYNNERLEFLGDALLGFEVADSLFRSVGDASEGELSRMRSHLVKREALAEVARGLELSEFVRLGPGELRSGGQARDSILADTVEALIAAVYLDGGIERSRQLVRELLGERLADPRPEVMGKDPKTRLQEFLQARGLELPHYEVVEISGEAHAQHFRVLCHTTIADHAEGSGSSRRRAEQAAAQAMLDNLPGEA